MIFFREKLRPRESDPPSHPSRGDALPSTSRHKSTTLLDCIIQYTWLPPAASASAGAGLSSPGRPFWRPDAASRWSSRSAPPPTGGAGCGGGAQLRAWAQQWRNRRSPVTGRRMVRARLAGGSSSGTGAAPASGRPICGRGSAGRRNPSSKGRRQGPRPWQGPRQGAWPWPWRDATPMRTSPPSPRVLTLPTSRTTRPSI